MVSKHKSVHMRLMACTLALLWMASCRLPKLFIDPPEKRLFYDTAYEQELIGKPIPSADSLAYDFKWRYRDTLAEPVAIERYLKNVESTWEVLFATNRVPTQTGESKTVAYENDFGEKVNYGRCSVTLTVPTEAELEAAHPDGMVGKLVHVLPKPWQEEVVFNEAAHTQVENVTPLSDEQFFGRLNRQLAHSRQKDLLIFVHGFNVDFQASVARLAQISRDMPFNGAIVAYSWPSQGGVDNYARDGEVVDESLAPFTTFLNQLQENIPPETKVNLVVHSMGNRLAMRSIARLPDQLDGRSKRFENIVLCAPDVGVDEFKRLAVHVLPHAHRTTLYRCLNDSALIASSYRNGEERAGGSHAPIIMKGLDTVECAVIDTSLLGHSYYGSNPHMLRDLFSIVKEHKSAVERPWVKRHRIPFQGDMWIIADWPVQLEWAWHFEQENSGIAQVGQKESSIE